MPIVNLNANFIKHHLQCPPGKTSIEYTSRDLPGFFVEVTAVSPGVGSYRLRYKERDPATGKPRTRYATIGRSNVIEYSDARKRAKELKSMLALGQNIKDNAKSDDKATLSSGFPSFGSNRPSLTSCNANAVIAPTSANTTRE
jgi:hypothetical protein